MEVAEALRGEALKAGSPWETMVLLAQAARRFGRLAAETGADLHSLRQRECWEIAADLLAAEMGVPSKWG